ncbi:TonB-dependent receptor [Parapedobacter koreensis]|uniref:TonB-dependent Receptor Plug Domain n=1 Tax=Parapedobacter koreensis TaxID=332977 RepID=A0A1H7MRQ1_9SPHI|nr:TonB-dependent receptor [Parapedobacter koreensis]SEL13883.1 TonB-dependent Receptor Plug Domain [Parapedobacter koreensis]
MKFIAFFLSLLLLQTAGAHAQQQVVISGTVKSKVNGETVIGATVSVDGTYTTSTNEYGFYALRIPAGSHRFQVNFMSFSPYTAKISVFKDSTINISLEQSAQSLDEVVITANPGKQDLASPQMGAERVSMQTVKQVPVLLGERDALKVIQLLPGIKSAGDGGSGLFVRGGSADQNMILLDEATVYNASHLLGFFSTFNADAIKDLTVYKGGMPAQYGGRLSSVLDIKMNDGNNQDVNISGGVGLISAKLNVEGPIQEGKSSFLVSGRRTYADMFLKLSNDSSINNNTLYFYDLNAKLNFQLGNNDRLYLSGYLGQDRMGAGDLFNLDWGNKTGTLRWNHIFSSRLFSNTSLIYSNYDYKIGIKTGADEFEIFSNITDYQVKQEFQWFANNRNNVRFGLQSAYHRIRPGEVTAIGGSSFNDTRLQQRYSWDNALYASNTWKATDRLQLTYGVRLSAFGILGEGDFYQLDANGNVTDTLSYEKNEFVKTYLNVEPRLAVSYQLTPLSSVKASYVRNVQNLHMLSNSSTASPTDKWLASTNVIKPEIADQYALGYYRNLFGGRYELNVETYYKDLQHQIDYRDGANVFTSNNAVESELLFGKGRAYGLEWLLRKNSGKLTGWISYTLSKTERQINGINNDQWYNARQDRTHDVAVVAMYQLNKKWSFSANWVFYTGDAVTFPAGKYLIDGETAYYYTERNGYRMPDYHRLDLGATMQLRQKKRWSSELSFSLYNAYGRENAYVISFEDSADGNRTIANQISLFRFVPSISYNFKFN